MNTLTDEQAELLRDHIGWVRKADERLCDLRVALIECEHGPSNPDCPFCVLHATASEASQTFNRLRTAIIFHLENGPHPNHKVRDDRSADALTWTEEDDARR